MQFRSEQHQDYRGQTLARNPQWRYLGTSDVDTGPSLLYPLVIDVEEELAEDSAIEDISETRQNDNAKESENVQ